MKFTMRYPKKYRAYGLWRLYVFQKLWAQMDGPARNYLRSWLEGQP